MMALLALAAVEAGTVDFRPTAAEAGVPAELRITALDENGQVLALAHRDYDVLGVQFHPESVLTEHGKTMLANWVNG